MEATGDPRRRDAREAHSARPSLYEDLSGRNEAGISVFAFDPSISTILMFPKPCVLNRSSARFNLPLFMEDALYFQDLVCDCQENHFSKYFLCLIPFL